MIYEDFVRMTESIQNELDKIIKTKLNLRETNYMYYANIRFHIDSYEAILIFHFHRNKFYMDIGGTLLGIHKKEENLDQLRHIIKKMKESFIFAMRNEKDFRMQSILSLDDLLLDYTEKTLKETIERNRS